MRLAVVIGSVTSAEKHVAYEGRPLLMIQRFGMDGKGVELPTMAIDYVGAGRGDVILVGAAPGLASTVLNYKNAPVQQLIMGIVDRIDLDGAEFDLSKAAARFVKARVAPQN